MAKKRVYPAEFQAKLVELVRSGKNANAIAREYEISRQSIVNGLKQDDLHAARRTDGMTSADSVENATLRKRIRELEIEGDILKKPQCGSLARPSRYPANLRIRENAPCRLASCRAAPRAVRLGQRVRVDQAPAVGARAGRRRDR